MPDPISAATSFAQLNGLQVKILRLAIIAAFVSEPSLDMFLKEELDQPSLNELTDRGTRGERIFSMIQVAMAVGWIDDLIAKLQRYRPNNVLVRNLPDALRLAAAREKGTVSGDSSSLERIVRGSGFADLRPWAERMSTIGQATCRIEVASGGGMTTYGTGVLVGDDLVLTNYHVIESNIVSSRNASQIKCRFDYAKDINGLDEGLAIPLVTGPDWLVACSIYDQADISGVGDPAADHLDFALLRLSQRAGQQEVGKGLKRGTIALSGSAAIPRADATVFIVQHPGASPMALAIGKIIDLVSGGTRLRYDADTEGGSSGSGVFDDQLQLIALHHAGDPRSKLRATYNQGIPIGRIANMLAELSVKVAALDQSAKPDDISPSRSASPDPPGNVSGQTGPEKAELPVPVRPTRKRGIATVPILISAAAVAGAVGLYYHRTPTELRWNELPNAEILKTIVVVRAAPSQSSAVLDRKLGPGDIESFGKAPGVRTAMIDHKRWYAIALKNRDGDVFLLDDDAPGAMVEWTPVDGCLRAKKPTTELYRASTLDLAADSRPFGEPLAGSNHLQTAKLGGEIWFRFRNANGDFRYTSAARVDKNEAANCPTQ